MASRAELFHPDPDRLAECIGPSLPLAPDWARFRLEALGSSGLDSYRAEIELAAADSSSRPVPELTGKLFVLFDTRGDRGRYEAPYFDRRRRLVSCALSAWLNGKADTPAGSRYLIELERLIEAILDETTWALPAHLEGTCLSPDACVPVPGFPPCPHREYLDLFSCETAFALSEILTILGYSLRPELAARMGEEIDSRALRPFLARPAPWRWELMVNNWCAVCAGSIGAAALYRVDDARRAAAILERVLPSMDRFLNSFSPDGACLEGMGYWTYGFGFFASFADLLRQATGGAIDLFSDPRAEKAAAFGAAAYLDECTALPFADGSTYERPRRGLARYLEKRYPAGERSEAPAALEVAEAPYGHDRYGRWALAFRDLCWGASPRPPVPGSSQRSRPIWYPQAQWLICPASLRSRPSEAKRQSEAPIQPEALKPRFGFAAKGGTNDEPHNHNDLGSFVLTLDGMEILADLGAGEYTRDYFGEGRYGIFCTSSFGHSLPIIAGLGQSAGATHRAEGARCSIEDGLAVLSLELGSAYSCPGLEGFRREFRFSSEMGLSLIDEFRFSEPGHEVVERFITRHPEALCIGAEGPSPGKLRIEAESPGSNRLAFEVLVHEHREHDGSTSLVTSLDWRISSKGKELRVEFGFTIRDRA